VGVAGPGNQTLILSDLGAMRERRIRPRTLIAVPALAVLALAGCGDDEDAAPAAETATAEAGITVTDAWSRQPAEGQAVTAVYGIVSNPTDTDVTVIAASTDVTDNVELHETLMGDDGAMSMREKEDGFVVPAGGEFVFESGGPHVMLFDIDAATYPAMIEVTLEFDNADPVTFMAEVRSLDGTDMGGDMGGHGGTDGEMDMHGGDDTMSG
jgi:periplasmic copper chaperone A